MKNRVRNSFIVAAMIKRELQVEKARKLIQMTLMDSLMRNEHKELTTFLMKAVSIKLDKIFYRMKL